MGRVTDCEGVDQMDGLRRTAGEEWSDVSSVHERGLVYVIVEEK
jgi:hypothetical protein